MNEELETVSNSEKEVKIKRAFCKEKKDVQALLLAAASLSAYSSSSVFRLLALPGSAISAPESSASPLASLSAMLVPGSSASLSATPVPMLGLSALPSLSAIPILELSAFPFPFAVLVLGLSALPSLFAIPMPGLSACPSTSAVPMPGSSALPSPSAILAPYPPFYLAWTSPQIPTPIPKRRRISQWSGTIKRASLEEAAPIFIPLFFKCTFPPPFSSSGIGKKQLFNKVLNLDSWPLANDYTGQDVDLSFVQCLCPSAVKANRLWQLKLLEQTLVCIVEAIPLVAAIFWDPNFILCP